MLPYSPVNTAHSDQASRRRRLKKGEPAPAAGKRFLIAISEMLEPRI
jgi:hypothetical protein